MPYWKASASHTTNNRDSHPGLSQMPPGPLGLQARACRLICNESWTQGVGCYGPKGAWAFILQVEVMVQGRNRFLVVVYLGSFSLVLLELQSITGT